MEYRRTTLHPYDDEDPQDDMESWPYPNEHPPFHWVLWDELKNLIWRCVNKQYKSQ